MKRSFWIAAEWLLGLAHVPEHAQAGGVRCARCGQVARTKHELLGGDDALSWSWMQGKRK